MTPEETYWPQLISIIDAYNSVNELDNSRLKSIILTKLEEAELFMRRLLQQY